jgi:hypothetical protein
MERRRKKVPERCTLVCLLARDREVAEGGTLIKVPTFVLSYAHAPSFSKTTMKPVLWKYLQSGTLHNVCVQSLAMECSQGCTGSCRASGTAANELFEPLQSDTYKAF